VPFDSPDIGRIVADLDSDPKRLRTIRRNNVREAALRHDWLHRIRVVFDVLGLPPTEGMRARTQRLDQVASQAQIRVRMNSCAPGSTRESPRSTRRAGVTAGTLRGVPHQKALHAEVKLVRCTRGAVNGDSAYICTDQTLISGENALQKLLARAGS
jgi:hypothetical protein